jgi:hypothetical protein
MDRAGENPRAFERKCRRAAAIASTSALTCPGIRASALVVRLVYANS